MDKESFTQIVEEFNKDKIRYNWGQYLTLHSKKNFQKTKDFINHFPTYYNFTNLREFKYWLVHSTDIDFINNRFCIVCGRFIECLFFIGKYNSACCEEHINLLRLKNTNETNKKLYGGNPILSLQNKIKANNLLKYGVEYPLQSKSIREKAIQSGLKNDSYKKSVVKVQQTKLERYGNINYNNSDKIKQTKDQKLKEDPNYYKKISVKRAKTTLKRYGVKFAAQSSIFMNKMIKTKQENKSINTSKPEEEIYNKLIEKFGESNIERQYKSDLYPFTCDFYIQSLDLYIEYQGFVTHGKEPYDESNKNHQKLIRVYKKRLKEGKEMYKRIIHTWTDLDPKKRKISTDNNLNWLEFFNLDQFYEWYNKIKGI